MMWHGLKSGGFKPQALATRTAGLSAVLARDGRRLALYSKDSAVHHYHTGLGAPALGIRVSAPARKLPRTVQQRPSQSPAGFRGSKVGPGGKPAGLQGLPGGTPWYSWRESGRCHITLLLTHLPPVWYGGGGPSQSLPTIPASCRLCGKGLKHRPSHRYLNMRQEYRTFKSVTSGPCDCLLFSLSYKGTRSSINKNRW